MHWGAREREEGEREPRRKDLQCAEVSGRNEAAIPVKWTRQRWAERGRLEIVYQSAHGNQGQGHVMRMREESRQQAQVNGLGRRRKRNS